MITVNAMGDACPIPVVKTKNAIRELGEAGGVVETLVDNEIAVQNLTKMANQKGYGVKSEKLAVNQFKVTMTVGEGAEAPAANEVEECLVVPGGKKKTVVVAISSDKMGEGSDELGHILMKSFLYALGQQDELPDAIIFYNGGAHVTCQESPALEDLKSVEAQGVEITTCGTCLDHYGLRDQLKVGSVSNMYAIVERLTGADLVIKP